MYNFSEIAGRCFGNEKLVKTAVPVQKVQNNFARVARKYFAEETNNAPAKESSAQEKLLAKFKEVNDGKFKDNANKFVKDNFDLIAESAGSKAGARVINHVKELCSKNNLSDVYEWLMQPKERDVPFAEFMKFKQQPAKEEKTEATQEAVPEAAPAANQAPKAKETKTETKSEQSGGEQHTKQSIKDDPSNPSSYTEVPAQKSQPDKATNTTAKKKISKKDLYDLIKTIGKIEWDQKDNEFITKTFPDAAALFEIEDIRSFLETAQEFVEAGKTIGSVADFVGRIFRLTPFNPLNLIRLAKVLWKGVESTPDVFWNEGTSQLFEGWSRQEIKH